MKKRFLHIYLKPNTGVTYPQIQAKMNLALDWFKYGDSWIVYSSSDLARWKSRLKPIAGGNGRYLICEIDPTKRVGWMPKSFWEWLGDVG